MKPAELVDAINKRIADIDNDLYSDDLYAAARIRSLCDVLTMMGATVFEPGGSPPYGVLKTEVPEVVGVRQLQAEFEGALVRGMENALDATGHRPDPYRYLTEDQLRILMTERANNLATIYADRVLREPK